MSGRRKPSILRWLKGMFLKHMHSMITCKEFEDFVLDYVEGDLPAAQLKVFELHMRMCRECREYLAAYQRSVEVGQAILGPGEEPVPTDVPEDLVKAILEARKH